MGRIGLVRKEGEKNEGKRLSVGKSVESICGEDVVEVVIKRRGRRGLKRILERYDIDRIATEEKVPDFAEKLLSEKGIRIYDGKSLIKKLLPDMVARASKYNLSESTCTVYAETPDAETAKIIVCAADRFRFVKLCGGEENKEEIAEYVMRETGLALEYGEYACGTAIMCDGRGGRQRIRIDMSEYKGIVLTDAADRRISVPLAEAICSNGKSISEAQIKLRKISHEIKK